MQASCSVFVQPVIVDTRRPSRILLKYVLVSSTILKISPHVQSYRRWLQILLSRSVLLLEGATRTSSRGKH